MLLHLEAGDDGEQLAMMRGVATLSADPAPVWIDSLGDEYAAKYGEWMRRLDLTMDSMAARYTTVIEVTPHTIVAW